MAKLIIFSGPSGVGKKTLLTKIINLVKYNCLYSISMTTRQKRPNEIDGKDYFFVTKERFIQAIKSNEMLEYATYIDNYYGTPKKFVNDNLKKGKNVLLEIEINGAMQILQKKISNVLSIFIEPPSLDTLKQRLIKRNTESSITINKRIKQAEWEIQKKNIFDYVLVNNNLEETEKKIIDIFNKELI